MITHEAIEKFLATGRAQHVIYEPKDGDRFFIDTKGEVTDVSGQYPPSRIKQCVKLHDAASFCEYVNRWKVEGATAIFAYLNQEQATFRAFLDYHLSPEKPAWCSHVASFQTEPTPEWNTWKTANRKQFSQIEFANWIEDNLQLFVPNEPTGAPTGAELLELVKSLHGHNSARFNTALRLHNGAYSVSYEEDVDVKGNCGSGAIDFPREICGGFPLFQGSMAYLVRARLKTRIQDRKLILFFETVALPQMVRESLMATVKFVQDETKILPLLGSVTSPEQA